MSLSTFLIYIATFLIILLTTIYLYFKKSYQHWKNEHIEYITPIFPYGNMKPAMSEKPIGVVLKDMYDYFKGRKLCFGGGYTFQKPFLLITDPDLLKCILTKDFEHFHDRGLFVDEINDPLSGHLLALEGTKWRKLRAKITPTFTSGKMKMMFQAIVTCTQRLDQIFEEHITKDKPIDTKDIFGRLSTDIIGTVAFGLDCNSLNDPKAEFRQHSKRIFEFHIRDIILNLIAFEYPSVLRFLKIPLTPNPVTKFFMNVIRQTIEYRESNQIHRNDFLDLLIKLKNNENILDADTPLTSVDDEMEKGITVNTVAAQSFIFFVAGYETTSSVINFGLYELACHVNIQEKLRKEVINVLQEHGGDLTYDAIKAMKYMDKVIKEILRKYPPVPMMQRKCTIDFPVPNSNYTIKKDTEILVATLGLHRDPEFYPDPELFDPERFNEDEKIKRHPYTYLPFSEGPRFCIGKRFAIMQVKIILATVLRNYKFTIDPEYQGPVQFNSASIFLSPLKPFYLNVTKV